MGDAQGVSAGANAAGGTRRGSGFLRKLPSSSRILAFQFKAPKGRWGEQTPYRFTIQRQQHHQLSALAANRPAGVHYVLPFYVTPAKLQCDVPHLLRDTWFLPVAKMPGSNLFGPNKTKRCCQPYGVDQPQLRLLAASS